MEELWTNFCTYPILYISL